MADGQGQQAAPALRASDADRERVTELLGEHAAAGRLTVEELGERVDSALAAVTRPELDALLADLPGEGVPAAPAPSRPQRRVSERTIAIMGGIELDLRQAEIVGHELEIVAFAFWGGIDIIVPEGIQVEVTSVPIMGGVDARVPDVPLLPGAPRIRVKAIAVMAGIDVKSKRRRQPVLRQPPAPPIRPPRPPSLPR